MKFIVCAPRYDETSGGSVVLHRLAAILQSLGHEVLLWPLHKVWRRPKPFSRHWWHRLTYTATRIYRPLYGTKPGVALNVATESDLDNGIVIYPETADGNPLQAKSYVYWLLYQSASIGKPSPIKRGDLYFCYEEAFNIDSGSSVYGGILCIHDYMTEIYTDKHSTTRHGKCYMIRKGRTRHDIPALDGETIIDGLSHKKIADIFNSHEYCYFYDLYTLYSTYAAMCGCIPVIVPLPGISKEQWDPICHGRPGIAYGENDIPHAIASRSALVEQVANAEGDDISSVGTFVNVVRAHFCDGAPQGSDECQ